MAGEIKNLQFSEGVSVSSPLDIGGGSGTGEVNFITNNNGGSDLDQSQTDAVGDWVDSGTGTTSSIETSSGNIPRYPFQDTGIKITNDGSGTAYTAVRFRVPPADRNKKLKIEWAQLTSGVVTGDFTVELYNYSDNYSTGETQITLHGSANIPGQNGVYYNEFDSDSREYYELRIVRAAGDAADFIVLNDVVVGPGKLHSGAVVTAWESFTPVLVGSTSNPTLSSSSGYWRRVGDSMQLWAVAAISSVGSGDYYLTLPDNKTQNSGILTSSASHLGNGFWQAAGTKEGLNILAHSFGSWTGIGLFREDIIDALDSGDNPTYVSFTAFVPILEWSGSGVLNTIVQDNTKQTTALSVTTNMTTQPTTRTANYWRVADRLYFELNLSGFTAEAGTDSTDFKINLLGDLGVSFGALSDGDYIVGTGYAQVSATGVTADGVQNRTTVLAVISGTTEIILRLQEAGADSNITSSSLNRGNVGPSAPDNISMTYLSLSGSVQILEWAGSQSSLVGFSQASSIYSGLAPKGVFDQNESDAMTYQQRSTTPGDPTQDMEARTYIKGSKFVIQWNDAGTVRYKYLDLTGTGVTWVHTTTAP